MGLIIGSRMTVAQPRSEKPAVGHSEQIQTVHDDNSPEKCRMYVQTAPRKFRMSGEIAPRITVARGTTKVWTTR